MNKPTLYLETTVPSYCTARISQSLIVAAHQMITMEWWQREADKYTIYTSQFVLDEVSEGDPEAIKRRLDFLSPFPLLETTKDVFDLTRKILSSKFFPKKAIQDASHVAIATVHAVDYLLTWNCTHINNAAFKERLQAICEQSGFRFPMVCTPEELMGEDL